MISIDYNTDGSESVILGGSESNDEDGNITSYIWTQDNQIIAEGINPEVTLPIGIHTIHLTVMDDDGLTDMDTVVISVEKLEDLVLESQCSPRPQTVRLWQVSNTNDTAIDFTWEIGN
ncbi:hypothetical protein G4Y79_20490 [Phototrophicus methaneseepsis]|uniref:PKD domain-containing protein n=1 Tax=Phototrophicus methaneseepsis TaxID=2710758 RepID=A0A7S8E805_9CHLR|nr:PKD domain-containing protein [Phototrophicus methaneseepsis]QPC82042.1 hypothetical protein G4Y79_20490 [Phototrophicus methaneseepsis]